MKHILACLLTGAVLAAPCAYDAFSPEPSPLAGLVALSVIHLQP
ncbi:hypothetical protein [Shinella sp. HZN7]|jgi:hypothetical protein|nr:hypothetical protein [Shinella sp. HZN7]